MTTNSKIPHPVASILWMAWGANAIIGSWAQVPSHTYVVLVSFLVLDLGGWAVTRRRTWAAQLVDVVWFHVPLPWARWFVGALVALGALVMVGPMTALALACWLGAQFAHRSARSKGDLKPREKPRRRFRGSDETDTGVE